MTEPVYSYKCAAEETKKQPAIATGRHTYFAAIFLHSAQQFCTFALVFFIFALCIYRVFL